MNPSLIALPWMLCFLSLYLLIFLFIHVGALQNPNPEAVVQEVQRRVNSSISRRLLSSTSVTSKDEAQCLTGNPIDDCWRCDSDWENNRQKLADCAVGFGQAALGGKGGQIYLVNDNSDSDVVNPTVGTLRHAVIQTEPLWIVFSGDMLITLKHELVVGSFKTIDGRGANVQITGGGCVVLQNVNNIVIHSVSISKCVPTGKVDIRLSPTQVEHRGKSDGDGITVRGSNNIWIDHCALSDCTDGLIDVTEGSTAVTISNCYFTHHDKVMLLGHSDDYDADKDMQVTVAFNYFGEGLTQRLPRCRLGYIHIVNNVYSGWGMYAIGGSANPTINSQGNRYTAPANSELKEVTRRMDADNSVWASWNWRSDGDTMVNGAFFTPSGEGIIEQYTKASSLQPKPADLIDQLTMTAGALIGPSGSGLGFSGGGGSVHGYSGGGLGFSGEGGNVHGYSNGNPYDIGMAPPPKSSTLLLSLLIISLLILYLTTNDGALL